VQKIRAIAHDHQGTPFDAVEVTITLDNTAPVVRHREAAGKRDAPHQSSTSSALVRAGRLW
jgi:hypothetical protein